MPAIAQKAKALGGKGVVLSYVDKPENFYWREQVPGTKRYLHRLLPNSSTLEEVVASDVMTLGRTQRMTERGL